MGSVALFAVPKVEPAPRWVPTESFSRQFGPEATRDLQRSAVIMSRIDHSTREKVAVLVNVLGLNYLADLCVDCALREIIALCERPDVDAVLTAWQKSGHSTAWKVG